MTPKASASWHNFRLLWKRLPGKMLINLFYQPRRASIFALDTPIGRPVSQVLPRQASFLNSDCSEVSLLPRAYTGPSSQGALQELRGAGWQGRRRGGCAL